MSRSAPVGPFGRRGHKAPERVPRRRSSTRRPPPRRSASDGRDGPAASAGSVLAPTPVAAQRIGGSTPASPIARLPPPGPAADPRPRDGCRLRHAGHAPRPNGSARGRGRTRPPVLAAPTLRRADVAPRCSTRAGRGVDRPARSGPDVSLTGRPRTCRGRRGASEAFAAFDEIDRAGRVGSVSGEVSGPADRVARGCGRSGWRRRPPASDDRPAPRPDHGGVDPRLGRRQTPSASPFSHRSYHPTTRRIRSIWWARSLIPCPSRG